MSLRRRHLRFGWWSLLAFLLLGLCLEALHGFRIAGYLAPEHETRRLLWTLAHAHGALLGLVHVAFAVTVGESEDVRVRRASVCLLGASCCLPGGFFLGGLFEVGPEPGLAILLVPLGAALLAYAVFETALFAGRPE